MYVPRITIPGAPTSLRLETALQSWTTHGTVEKSIDYAKQIGVHYIEIYPGQDLFEGGKGKFDPGMTAEQIEKILAIAKAADVKIIDTGVIGISSNEAEARKLFDWAKKLGITIIVSEPEEKALPMINKVAGEYHIKVRVVPISLKPSCHWDPNKHLRPDQGFAECRILRRCRTLEAEMCP